MSLCYSDRWNQRTIPEIHFKELVPAVIPLLDPRNNKDLLDHIATILCRMQKLNLSSDVADVASRIEDDARSSDRKLLVEIYLPFLQCITPRLEANHFLNVAPFQTMFRGILNLLFDACADLAPQFPTGEWVRLKYGCGRCRACNDMDEFLTSPTSMFFEFSGATPIRDHLERCLKSARSTKLLHITTERSSVPWMLVVRKTEPLYEQKRTEWEEARNTGRAAIAKMPSDHLQVLLGDEFERLVTLSPKSQVINLVEDDKKDKALTIKTESGVNASPDLKRKQPHSDTGQDGEKSDIHTKLKRGRSNSPSLILHQIPEY